MAEYRSTRIDDIEAIYGGSMKRARSALDITAFGLQVMDIPPNATGYPEHDHSSDGQEEVYVTLRGSATLDIEGTPVTLDPDHLVSVKSGTRRKVVPGDEGVRILVIGGVPGEAYAPAQWTEVGTPDPGAS